MSRSDKTLNEYNTNPALRFFEWSGEKGQFKWYDKETKETHFIDKPFTFLVLDQLNTIKGYDEATDTGFFANEVRNTKTPITLRTKAGIVKTGLWKGDLEHIDGTAFTKSVYIGFKLDGQLVLGNLQLKGSALGGLSDKAPNIKELDAEYCRRVGWFNFTRATPDIEDIAVAWTGIEKDKKGSNAFYRPVFSRVDNISQETLDAAVELDKILQTYLKAYLSRDDTPHEHNEPDWSEPPPAAFAAAHSEQADELDEIPF